MLGPAPQDVQQSPQKASAYLADLVKTTRRIRRMLSPHSLARECQEDAMYTLSDLCAFAGLSPHSLEDRLALAKLIHQHPRLFTQQRSIFDGEGLALYCLSPEWREAIEEPEEQERPDQNWILSVIEQYLGTPTDLYRRSIDPDTGDVTLGFHFPEVARLRYAEAIDAAAEETGVSITLSPSVHQGMLAETARSVLPQGLTAQGSPSIYHDQHAIQLTCTGEASDEAIAGAKSQFHEATGWHLQIARKQAPGSPLEPRQAYAAPKPGRVGQHEAMQRAQRLLGPLPGYVKVSMDVMNAILLPRFHFPDVASTRYAEQFTQLEEQTGWSVRLQPTVHHQALIDMAHRLLPAGLSSLGTPSLFQDEQRVRVPCSGKADAEALQEACQRFLEETGWYLELVV